MLGYLLQPVRSIWTLTLILSITAVTIGKQRQDCTCICSEENNDGSVYTIYGRYCDDRLNLKPEGRDTPDCNDAADPNTCAIGNNLVEIRGARDTCLCYAAVIPGYVCKCRGPAYEDVRRRGSAMCTCSEGLFTTTIIPTTSKPERVSLTHGAPTVPPTIHQSELGISRSDSSIPKSDGHVGVRPQPTLPNYTRRQTTPLMTMTPGSANVAVIVGSIVAVLVVGLIVIAVVIIITRHRRRELMKRNRNIRYDSNIRKRSDKSGPGQEQDDNMYTPVSPAPQGTAPMYTEYKRQIPSIYTVPEQKTGTSVPSDEQYECVEGGKPRPPARVPSADDYSYITPLHYAKPYSDVAKKITNDKDRLSGSNLNGENVEDDEQYIEIIS